MKWYLAKLVFRVICANGTHKPQFDEQLRLISAEDDLHAFHKARLAGETENTGDIQTPAKWNFIDVSELHVISEFADGVELYSKVLEEEDAGKYISRIYKMSAGLLQAGIDQFTAFN